jgi:hypothetical protein
MVMLDPNNDPSINLVNLTRKIFERLFMEAHSKS